MSEVSKAPVELVGGSGENGPWGDDIDEIEVGNSYVRSVKSESGTSDDVEVEITNIQQIGESGYVVSFCHV